MNRIIGILFIIAFSFNAKAQNPELILPLGHTEELSGVRTTPDGNLLVTASKDGTAKIWNYRTGRMLHNLVLHKSDINDMAMSQDGRFFILVSADGTYSQWETATGKLLFHSEPGGRIEQCYLLQGDSSLVLRTTYGVYVYKVGSTELPVSLVEIADSINNQVVLMRLSPGSGTLAVFDEEYGLSYFRISDPGNPSEWQESNSEDRVFTGEGSRYYDFDAIKFWRMQFANDSELVVQFQYYYMLVFDVRTGKEVYRAKPFRDMEFSNDGQYMAGMSYNNDKIVVLDFRKKDTLYNIGFTSYDYVIVGFMSNDSNLLIYSSNRGLLEEWTPAGDRIRVTELMTHQRSEDLLHFDPRQNLFFTHQRGYVAEQPGSARVYHAGTGTLLNEYAGKVDALRGTDISDDGRYLFEIKAKYANYWDQRIGKSIRLPRLDNEVVNKIHYLPGLSRVLLQSYSQYAMYDLSTQRILYQQELDYLKLLVLPGDSLFATVGKDKIMRVCRVTDGDVVLSYETNYLLTAFALTSDRRFLAGIYHHTNADSVFVWDIRKNELITSRERSRQYVETTMGFAVYTPKYTPVIQFSPDDKVLFYSIGEMGWMQGFTLLDDVVIGTDTYFGGLEEIQESNPIYFSASQKIIFNRKDSIAFWRVDLEAFPDYVAAYDYRSDRELFRLKQDESMRPLAFDETKNLLYTVAGNVLIAWDTRTQKIKKKWQIPAGLYAEKICLATGQLLVSGNDRVGLLPLDSKKPTYYLSTFNSGDFIAFRPDGYYLSTPTAAKWLSWKINDQLYDFDQWDLQYNRPDKLIEAMDVPGNPLRTAFYQAYTKRLRRQGINEKMFRSDFHIPQTRWIDAPVNGSNVQEGVLSVRLSCRDLDPSNQVNRIMVLVNDNPLHGKLGFMTNGKKADSIYQFSIPLTTGVNHIRVSCLNQRGAESLRQQIQVNYLPAVPSPSKTYFIGIGIDRFADDHYNLQWSVKDIRDLARRFREKEPGIKIDTLFNEDVTIEKVKALKSDLKNSNPQDKIIIAYSGHGLLAGNYDYYLSTYAVNFEKPESGGLPYEELENLLDSIPARQKLLLIDACHSGELDKEELADYYRIQQELDSTQKGFAPVVRRSAEAGVKNSFELMQELFSNLNGGTGATVISAAAGTQFALEKGDLQNGVFTYSILECMIKNIHATLSQLKQYVYTRVQELTQGAQVPTTRNETRVMDWRVW